ncbi:metal-sensitive transcriptional regulator [Candidatus Dojkabacteria bacterium]|uniref:Metal-sensitive transcriptional regulator n=1 Tax=Candidatus Dojkabacteria bacterium TaxID=2099670 RepID=A0A955HWT0_9BACT|nr:metal-sensitive transcriptional regulator [Candidatus Dojkabacteria bacterium]MCB9790632.1 metal-sensitive transcriptional regulator [Candidatus Nomurabacteria bacterium]
MPRKGPSTLQERLHRIEGQVRGVEKLLNNSESTEKISVQIQAIISSLESVKIEIIKKQLKEELNRSVESVESLIDKIK